MYEAEVCRGFISNLKCYMHELFKEYSNPQSTYVQNQAGSTNTS